MKLGIKKIIQIGVTSIVIVLVGYYSYIETKDFIAGPVLEIEYPGDGELLNDSLVEVKGVAKNISHIEMNGRKIYVDEEGNFNENILLSYGYNIIEVFVKDRFGREKEDTLELVYK